MNRAIIIAILAAALPLQAAKVPILVDEASDIVTQDANYTGSLQLNGVDVATTATSGENNTASNQGAGTGLFKQKTGVDLEFNSVDGAEGVTLSLAADVITFELDINSLVADGTPDGAADFVVTYDASAGDHKKVLINNLPFGGVNSVTGGEAITNSGTATDPVLDLDIASLALQGSPAAGMFLVVDNGGTSERVDWSSLPAGGGGESNTASNQGAGTGIFKQKTGVDLEFNSLGAAEGVQLSLATDVITFSADVNGLTTDATPDGAADFVMTYDTSAGEHKKVLLNNLPGGGGGGVSTVTAGEGLTNSGTANDPILDFDFQGLPGPLTAIQDPVNSLFALYNNSSSDYRHVPVNDMPATSALAWRFNTSLTPPVTAGDFLMNTNNVATVTQLYVSDQATAASGPDLTALLSSIIGGRILVRESGRPAFYMVLKVNGTPTDSGNYFTIDVTVEASSGPIFATGANCTFDIIPDLSESPNASGGAWVPISTQTVSSPVSSVDFTTGIDDSYNHYRVVWRDFVPSAVSDTVASRIGSGSFDSGANYSWTYLWTRTSTASPLENRDTAATLIRGGANGTSSGGSKSGSGEMIFSNLRSSEHKNIQMKATDNLNSNDLAQLLGAANWRNTALVDRVQFFALSGGNIAGGTFTLYGLREIGQELTGQWVNIQTQTVTVPVSSVDFTSGITDTYDEYRIVYKDFIPVENNRLVVTRMGSGSFDAGANYIYSALFSNSQSGSATVQNDTAATFVRGGSNGTATGGSQTGSGHFHYSNLREAKYKNVQVSSIDISAANEVVNSTTAGTWLNTAIVDRLQIMITNGSNIDEGTFTLQGRKLD